MRNSFRACGDEDAPTTRGVVAGAPDQRQSQEMATEQSAEDYAKEFVRMVLQGPCEFAVPRTALTECYE